MPAAVKWVLGYGIALAFSIPLYGLLISATWNWFVVPVTAARSITISQGLGLSIFVSVIGSAATRPLKEWKFDDGSGGIRRIAARGLGAVIGIGIAAPLLMLMVAWVFHALFLSGNSN